MIRYVHIAGIRELSSNRHINEVALRRARLVLRQVTFRAYTTFLLLLHASGNQQDGF